MKNRLIKGNDNRKYLFKLREDLRIKQTEIQKLQEDILSLKKENLNYVNHLNEMNSLLEAAEQKQGERVESQENRYEENIALLQKSYRGVCGENEKLRQENKRLELMSEELKREVGKNRDNEQLKVAMQHFEESQEKVNKMEKLCIQQKFEITELDRVIENFRHSIIKQKQKMDNLMNDNSQLKANNARLVKIEAKFKQKVDEEMKKINELTCHYCQMENILKPENIELLIKTGVDKEGWNKRPVVAQKREDLCGMKLDELLKAQAEVDQRAKGRDWGIKEYEKRLERMMDEAKTLQSSGGCKNRDCISRRNVEKLADDVKYTKKEDINAPSERVGTKTAQSDDRTGQLKSKINPEDRDGIRAMLEDREVLPLNTHVACAETRTNWPDELCMQCKYQNDHTKDTIERMIKAKQKSRKTDNKYENDLSFSPNDDTIRDKFEILERQIAQHQKSHDEEANRMQQAWASLQLSLQKLNSSNVALSERISKVQSEVAVLRQVGDTFGLVENLTL